MMLFFSFKCRPWQLALVALIYLSMTATAFSIGRAPLRILVVGDSMTHQKEGDYTWRFRLWQWFQQENISVEFVGPYHGTSLDHKAIMHDQLETRAFWDQGVNWEGGYAPFVDAAFVANSSYHFAAAGRPMRDAKDWIVEVLKLHPADMMLVMLGINDLAFCCSAEGVVTFGEELIANARKVVPDMKFAFANAPYQSFMTRAVPNTIRYNEYLPGNITKWSTARSPVHLVDLANRYGCGSCDCPGGFDGLHPNNWGDFHIAYAFSETLINSFGMGSCPVEIPDREAVLVRFLPAPNKLKVMKSKTDMMATWDGVYGAYQYRIEISKNGGQPVVFDLNYNYWTEPVDSPRTKYTIRVAALAQQEVGIWSEPQSAVYVDAVPSISSRRDVSAQPEPEAISSREVGIPCVGNTPPKQQSCTAWRQENPYAATMGSFSVTSSNMGYLVLLALMFVSTWAGYRALRSRGHRKYLRLDGWRSLGTSLLSDEK